VIKRDLAQAPARSKGSNLGARPEPIVTDASPMRKTIARRLVESKTTIPHYYLTVTINATPLWNAREQINSELASEQVKVSFNDLIVKAVAVALHKHPRANASWINDKIVQYQTIDISIAVAVEDGLITPVIRDADKKNIAEIAHEARDLAERGRHKKLRAEEIQGGTFSISNLGMFGTEHFAAVINPPQGAILAIGAIREEPVIEKGQVVPGRRMSMTLSGDHRVIDGAIGAAFLDSLRAYLENPVTIFLR
jgi:pyruvate dehydrogenase E2 component (dihydrolipoamide acetyltransferase)